MKTYTLMTAKAVLFSVVLVLIAGSAWGTYGVRISDLQYAPTPPNPIRVAGKISSTAPLRISDGRGEIAISGLTANMGDFLSLEGNWNGTTLAVSQSPCKVIMYSPHEMVYIPAGSFDMGTSDSYSGSHGSDEHPQHSVYLSGYYIGKYEVTRGEYRAFMTAGGYSNSSYWSSAGWTWKGSRTQPGFWAVLQNWGTGSFTQTDSYPVVGVSYYEAEAFCNWAGGRLPTEAQWEKAARWTGSYPNVYPWGDTWDLEKYNNHWDSNPAGGGSEKYQTSPVGSYVSDASPYGCQDMAGNVCEWCKDWYLSNYYSQSPASDPQGPTSGSYRVVRGASYCDSFVDISRCASRYFYTSPSNYISFYGFRLAR